MSSLTYRSAPSPGSYEFPPPSQSPEDSGTSPKDSGTAEGQFANDSVDSKKQRVAADRYFVQEDTRFERENVYHDSPKAERRPAKREAQKARSGGFLLEPAPLHIPKTKRHTDRQTTHGHEHRPRAVDKSNIPKPTIAKTMMKDGHGGHRSDSRRHPSASIDPSDIVRMALSLNESRRISNGHGNAPSTLDSPGGRHIPIGPRTISPPSATHQLGSLREYLNKPGSGHSGDPASASLSPTTRNSSGTNLDSSFVYHFSPGTLARADRARNFLQLQAEYRRALSYLPPLHPTKSKDGKQSGQIHEKEGQIELGRPYNPLQYLRNKRVRMREQMILDPASMGWNDTYNVKTWVDSLAQRVERAGFADGDVVHLPGLSASQLGRESSFGPLLHEQSSDPFSHKISRPKFDWSITPEGLLADAYWMEQDGHKTYIESKSGAKIFERFQQPQQPQWAHSGERRLLQRPGSLSSNGSTASDDERVPASMSTSKSKTNESRSWKRINAKPVGYSKHAAAKVKRHLLRRRTASSSSSGTASDLERSPRVSMSRARSSTAENIGPLERHMKQVQVAELSKRPSLEYNNSNNNGNNLSLQPTATSQGTRRGGFSEEHDGDGDKQEVAHKERESNENLLSLPSSPSAAEYEGIPRISLDNFDGVPGISKNLFEPPKAKGFRDTLKRTTRVPRLGIFRRGGSKAENAIDENDFAKVRKEQTYEPQSPRQNSSPSTVSSPSKNNSYSNLPKLTYPLSRSRPGSQDNSSAPTRKFFKGGRLGQLIRDEQPKAGADTHSRSYTPRKQSKTSLMSNESTESGEEDPILVKNEPQRLRSLSSGDLSRSNNFHIKNLPTFRSANAPEPPKDLPSPVPENKAEEATLQDSSQVRNSQRRMSRFQRLRTDTPDSSDVSPNTSALDLRQSRRSHQRAATSDGVGLDRRRDPSIGQSVSRSRSRVRDADNRLNAVLEKPGGVGRGGLPVTGLSRLEVEKENPRTWSISKAPRSAESSLALVSRKEVSYARCHLLSTGIMAKGILQKANEIPSPPSDFLKDAVLATGLDTPAVVRRLEYATAANLFSKKLEKMVTIFEESAQNFRQHTHTHLHGRIDDLRDKVTPALAPAVQSCSDSADAFVAELTTTKTMAVKQVNDAVDLMIRSRRRRLRYFKRSGFALLEWTLVGLMWWIWLFVFLFRGCRSVIYGITRFAKWLFWL